MMCDIKCVFELLKSSTIYIFKHYKVSINGCMTNTFDIMFKGSLSCIVPIHILT